MPPFARLRPFARISQSHNACKTLYRSYATRDPYSDKVATNDPSPPEAVQNVSDSNAVPTSAMGLRDAPLQEMPEESEKQRQMQAPNRAEVWSRSQESRERAMSGPRFEQTMMQFQVRLILGASSFSSKKVGKLQTIWIQAKNIRMAAGEPLMMVDFADFHGIHSHNQRLQ